MKIGIIAATGQEGRLITEEALRRGHEVTAIVRNAEKAADLGVPILERDIFDLRTEDLKGFDAVVSAFGVSPGSGLEFQYQTVGFTLAHLFEQLPDVRLLIVGGAASLFTDESMKTRIIESGAIPEAYAAVPYNAWLSFMALQKSSCTRTDKAGDLHHSVRSLRRIKDLLSLYISKDQSADRCEQANPVQM